MALPQITIDIANQKVLEDAACTFNYLETNVANNGFVRLRCIAPANRRAHIVFQLGSEGKAYFKTYLGTTYTADGTLTDGIKLTHFSRCGALIDGLTLRYNPTIDVLGSKRGNQIIFGGSGPISTGISRGTGIESIIQPGCEILVELQNVSGNVKDMEILGDYYKVVV